MKTKKIRCIARRITAFAAAVAMAATFTFPTEIGNGLFEGFGNAIVASAATGDFTVTGGTEGTDYKYENNVLTILTETSLTISGTTTSDRIVVNDDVDANITLDNVNIDLTSHISRCAFKIADNSTGNVTITLKGTNVLKSDRSAGLQKNGDTNSGTLKIQGPGSLEACGGFGAGIGGGSDNSASNITITDCTVKAIGGSWAAGIGGDNSGDGSNIIITDSTVTATGGSLAAGIGGGVGGSGSNITITDSIVTATGESPGEGIGGGKGGSVSNIKINGGSVNSSPIDNYVVFKNNDGKNVYCFTIPAAGTTPVKVDGQNYTPARHSDTDSNIYAYLPDLGSNNPHKIQIGTADPKYYIYDTSHKTWVEKTINETITITDLAAPEAGNSFDTSATVNALYKIKSVKWQDSNSNDVTGSTAGYNKEYTALITVEPANASDKFDLAGGITASVNGNTSQIENPSDRELTVKYTFPATRAAKVSGITIKTKPTNTTFYYRGNVDISGCKITAAYEDGTAVNNIAVQSEWVTGFDTNTVGDSRTATVTYNGQTATFTYSVIAVESIAVKTAPTKTSYYFGDTADISGCEITATYTDNSTKDITVESDWVTGFDTNTVGGRQATITYDLNAETPKTTTFTYSVIAVESIAVKTAPTKTSYYFGDTTDISGCKITATYTDNSAKDITVESDWVTGFDTNTVGSRQATITYDQNDAETPKTATFTYDVKAVGDISNGYYQISDEAGLRWFSDYVNDGHSAVNGILLNDITVTSDWTPIGTSASPFEGIFDGAGYTVSGLTFNDNSSDNAGLFGYIKNGAVKKVCVSDASFNGNENVGGICGYNNGGTISECLVSDSTISGKSNVGGIAGKSSGAIENCCNAGSVIGSGIVGNGSGGTISKCLNIGKVTVDNILGSGNAAINNCFYNKELSDVTSGNGTGKTTIELTNDSFTIGGLWDKTANDLDAKKLYYPNLRNLKANAPYVTYEPSLKLTNTNTGPVRFGDDITFTFDAVLTMEGKDVAVTSQLDPTTLSELQFTAEHNNKTVSITSEISSTPSVKIKLLINDKEAGYITYDFSANKVIVVITENFDVGTHKVNINYNGTGEPMFTGAYGSCSVTVEKADSPVVTEPAASDIVYGQLLSASVLDDNWSWVDGSVVPTVNNSGYNAYISVDDKNFDFSNVDGYSPTMHAVIRTIRITVKPAVPAIVATAKPEAAIPGKVINVSAVVSNPNNSNLTDFPAAKLTYKIGSGAEQNISGGSFVIPENTVIGSVITVTAATPKTDNYAVGTDSVSVIVTNCEHTNKTLEYSENAHWYHCSSCGADIDREAHNGGTATCSKRAVCAVCNQLYGSTDSNNHTGLSTQWSSDATGHWHECADCHTRTDKAVHISDGPATVDKPENCTVCSYEITPAIGRVGTPRILPNGGRFSNAVTVTIECASDSASVYYTTDGSDPAVSGIFYEGAFTLDSDTTVRAIAKKSGMTNSFEASAKFVFSDDGSDPKPDPKPDPEPEHKPIVMYPIITNGNVIADKSSAAAGKTVNVRTDFGYDIIVTDENGRQIARITENGSFTMPESKVYVTAVQNGNFALMATAWSNSYVYSYDSDMNRIKVNSTKKRGVIIIDLGEEYAGKSFTIYSGGKSTKNKVTEGEFDENGKFVFEVPDGKNYTLVVED